MVLGAAFGIGLVADLVVGRLAQRHETRRAQIQIQELLAVVEPSTSAACFSEDRRLANETATGLLNSPSIAMVEIRGSEAEQAGLRVGDTIVELQGRSAGRESREELARLNPGDTITVRVRARRGGERELKWKAGSRQEISYAVKDLDQVTDQQRARRAAWLNGEAQSAIAATSGAAGTGK